eukprot:TCONS_00041342-protein
MFKLEEKQDMASKGPPPPPPPHLTANYQKLLSAANQPLNTATTQHMITKSPNNITLLQSNQSFGNQGLHTQSSNPLLMNSSYNFQQQQQGQGKNKKKKKNQARFQPYERQLVNQTVGSKFNCFYIC